MTETPLSRRADPRVSISRLPVQSPKTMVVGGLLLVAVLALATAGVRFATVRQHLDTMAGDGSAEPYTIAIHQRLRAMAATVGVLASVMAWYASRVRREKWRQWQVFLTREFRIRTESNRRSLGVLWHRNVRWLLGLTLAATVLRLLYLWQPIRHDEAYTWLHFAKYPWYIGISHYTDPNNHVFHTLCVHIVTRVLGGDVWAVRIPALLAGVLLIPATALLAMTAGGRTAGIVAGVLVTVSTAAIEYSANARGYTLVSLLAVVGAFAALLIYRGSVGRRRGGWEGLVLISASALGLWANPVMLYPTLMIWTWLAVAQGWLHGWHWRRKWMTRWALGLLTAGAFTVVLYLPVFLVSGWSALAANKYVRALAWDEYVVRVPLAVTETYGLLARDWPIVTQSLAGLGVVGFFWSSRQAAKRHQIARWATLAAAALCAVFVLIQRVAPPARVWLPLIPFLALLSAVGITELVKRLLSPRVGRAAWMVLALVGSAWPVSEQIRRQSIWRSYETGVCPEAETVAMYLDQDLPGTPAEPVLVVARFPVSAPLVYYFLRHDLGIGRFEYPDERTIRSAVVLVTRTYPESVAEVLAEFGLEELAEASEFRVIKEFPTVALYQIAREEPSVSLGSRIDRPCRDVPARGASIDSACDPRSRLLYSPPVFRVETAVTSWERSGADGFSHPVASVARDGPAVSPHPAERF